MKFPFDWSKKRKVRFLEGVAVGQKLAEAGEPFPDKFTNAATAYASGLRTGYSKRRQRLNVGPKPQELTEKLGGRKRVRHNSVLVKYDTGDTYHLINVRQITQDEGVVAVQAALKDGTSVSHFIPLHNKDVVTYYGPKPKLLRPPVLGSDPEFVRRR